MSLFVDLFSERSIVVEYWKYIFPGIFLVYSFAYFIGRTRASTLSKARKFIVEQQEQMSDGSNPQRMNLAEEEYIGEFQPEQFPDDLVPSLEVNEHVPFAGATVTLGVGGAQKFYEIADNRRSVRSFSRKPVDYELIKTCVAAAGTGPSGAHTEPWTFCVISDHTIKQQIREIVEMEEYQNYDHRMARQWTVDLSPLKTDHVKEYLTDAPYLILIFKQIYGQRPDGLKKQHYYNEISVSIATGILLSALQCAGLNSLITTPLNCGPALRSLLNRPSNEKLLVLLPVGYPSDDCLVPNLTRKSVDEILVHY